MVLVLCVFLRMENLRRLGPKDQRGYIEMLLVEGSTGWTGEINEKEAVKNIDF